MLLYIYIWLVVQKASWKIWVRQWEGLSHVLSILYGEYYGEYYGNTVVILYGEYIILYYIEYIMRNTVVLYIRKNYFDIIGIYINYIDIMYYMGLYYTIWYYIDKINIGNTIGNTIGSTNGIYIMY